MLRLAEMAAAIRVDQLDMVRDQVAILGKGSKWRTVPFGNVTGKALTRYLRARSGHPLACRGCGSAPAARRSPATASPR